MVDYAELIIVTMEHIRVARAETDFPPSYELVFAKEIFKDLLVRSMERDLRDEV